MPAIGFTVFKEKILSGEKRQTIRKYTAKDKKRPFKKRRFKFGATLYLYWHLRQKDCELLREETCNKVLLLKWKEFKNDEGVARRDGFTSAEQMQLWFNATHSPEDDDLFWIVRW